MCSLLALARCWGRRRAGSLVRQGSKVVVLAGARRLGGRILTPFASRATRPWCRVVHGRHPLSTRERHLGDADGRHLAPHRGGRATRRR